MRFHPLHTHLTCPNQFNNPMGYIVHPLCQLAAKDVQQYISSVDLWQEEISRGKMFGVLVVEDENRQIGFLAAYSGLLGNRNDWEYFVPAVFDFQQPDGYFKQEEAKISAINEQVRMMEQSPRLAQLRESLIYAHHEMEKELKSWKATMEEAKQRRDTIRRQLNGHETIQGNSLPTEKILIRESQWMKAELRRKRKHHLDFINVIETEIATLEKEIQHLRIQRRQKSEALQNWLFEHFQMLNAKGERRNLLSIFAKTSLGTPPSGAGECCAPKLLQYAFAHHLRPVSIAEFWWGRSPEGEIRHHLQYYPACRGKCLPILGHMLQGLDVEANPYEQTIGRQPTILFEDDILMVVNKPSGMLSVPGKIKGLSVWDFVKSNCPQADGPLIVHRLDMATSGLLVIAKTKMAHQQLQQQFLHHTIEKTYIALLERPLPANIPTSGTIQLPLRPAPMDRPRQMVDHIHGKKAVTQYEMVTENLVRLRPLTGRTHQLRVHCAHHEGLRTPIKGDTIYGQASDHLYLHAECLCFDHPISGERMSFTSPTPF